MASPSQHPRCGPMTDIEHPVNLRQMPAKGAGEFRSTNLLIPHALIWSNAAKCAARAWRGRGIVVGSPLRSMTAPRRTRPSRNVSSRVGSRVFTAYHRPLMFPAAGRMDWCIQPPYSPSRPSSPRSNNMRRRQRPGWIVVVIRVGKWALIASAKDDDPINILPSTRSPSSHDRIVREGLATGPIPSPALRNAILDAAVAGCSTCLGAVARALVAACSRMNRILSVVRSMTDKILFILSHRIRRATLYGGLRAPHRSRGQSCTGTVRGDDALTSLRF